MKQAAIKTYTFDNVWESNAAIWLNCAMLDLEVTLCYVMIGIMPVVHDVK
jgi:hypothetical protein